MPTAELSAPPGVVVVTITPPGGPTATIHLPPAALGPLARLVADHTPGDGEVTLADAAARVRLPVPYLEAAVAAGELPARRTPAGAVVGLAVLAVYASEDRARRSAILDEMVAENQALGLYD